jgi:hypothetical protein
MGSARFQQNRDVCSHKVFFLQDNAQKVIHSILTETLGEYAPSYGTVKNWVVQFKRCEFSTCVGRSKRVNTPELIEKIHELILKDRRISAKPIAEQLGISSERLRFIFHVNFDMLKPSVKCVSKGLSEGIKCRLSNY